MGVAVWKFPLPQGALSVWQEVTMPERSEIVHVGQQSHMPVIWAVVDPDTTLTEIRRLAVVPTGEDIGRPAQYHGTVHLHDGRIVLHVFEDMG